MRKIRKGMVMIVLCGMLVGCGENETKEQTTQESQTVQEAQEETKVNIPENAINGMWENSYVDIRQENEKYHTEIYLSSADISQYELIYFTIGTMAEVICQGAESDFCIITSSGEYALKTDTKRIEDSGFPKEWNDILKDCNDDISIIKKNISADFSDSFDNWLKYSFGKYLDKVIGEKENESGMLETKEKISENETTEESWKTVGERTYDYDDGSEMILRLSLDKDEQFHFTIGLNISGKWKAAYVFTVLVSAMKTDELKIINPLVMLRCEDDLLISNGLSVDSNGELINNSEWLAEGLTDENYNEEEAKTLIDSMANDLANFMESEVSIKIK